ncbi:hypothetical protein C8R47DRAFT_1143547 [Mycena vitilis]|nr:hypothetical protein C8R47DRAFT_1143547 [Mycena vitilis]
MQARYTEVFIAQPDVSWSDVVIAVSATWLALFFYAFYLNLFILALYTLALRKTAARTILLGFTWAMALLGTTQIILRLLTSTLAARHIYNMFEENPAPAGGNWDTVNALTIAQNVLFPVNNLVADALFLYRCYTLWGARWKVVLVPGFLMLSTFAVGCMAAAPNFSTDTEFQRSPYVLATATNLVLMLLTAGRIWWIRRATLHVGSDSKIRQERYSSVIAMILESGALYCVATVLLTITAPLEQSALVEAAATHLVNIVPTLIIVRVGLGYHTQDNAEIDAKQAIHLKVQLSAHPLAPQLAKRSSCLKSSEDEQC